MSSEAISISSTSQDYPQSKPELKPSAPLSLVPETTVSSNDLDISQLVNKLDLLENPTGEKALLIILELCGILPSGSKASDQAKRLRIIYDTEKAALDLDDYIKEGDQSKDGVYFNTYLFDKTEKYENTPILIAIAKVLAKLRDPKASEIKEKEPKINKKKYEEVLQRADRIARMQLLLEEQRLLEGVQ